MKISTLMRHYSKSPKGRYMRGSSAEKRSAATIAAATRMAVYDERKGNWKEATQMLGKAKVRSRSLAKKNLPKSIKKSAKISAEKIASASSSARKVAKRLGKIKGGETDGYVVTGLGGGGDVIDPLIGGGYGGYGYGRSRYFMRGGSSNESVQLDGGEIEGGELEGGKRRLRRSGRRRSPMMGGSDSAPLQGGELEGGELAGGELEGGKRRLRRSGRRRSPMMGGSDSAPLQGGELEGGELEGGELEGGELEGGEIEGGKKRKSGKRKSPRRKSPRRRGNSPWLRAVKKVMREKGWSLRKTLESPYTKRVRSAMMK
jgi:hypothetical protein